SSSGREQALRAFVAHALGQRDVAVEHASTDAGLRRYWRAMAGGRSYVVMDAPPQHNDLAPFLTVAAQLRDTGLAVPDVLAGDLAQGFLLLSDLGPRTMLE